LTTNWYVFTSPNSEDVRYWLAEDEYTQVRRKIIDD